jgi:hypothetical protein
VSRQVGITVSPDAAAEIGWFVDAGFSGEVRLQASQYRMASSNSLPGATVTLVSSRVYSRFFITLPPNTDIRTVIVERALQSRTCNWR